MQKDSNSVFTTLFLSFFLSSSLCRVLNALLPALRKKYCMTKNTDLSKDAFDSDFEDIERLVERKKVVVWADQTTEHSNQSNLPGISLLMTFPQLGPIQAIPCCKYNFFFFDL